MEVKRFDIPNLTAIRGVAAILVVVFHFEILFVFFMQPSTSMFFRKCYLLVDLFFILSGFVMYHVYRTAFTAELNLQQLRKYAIKRFARIYPLYLFSLCLVIVLVFIARTPLTGIYDLKTLPADFILLQSFGVNPSISWNVPSWSISAECFAYLVFPFVIKLVSKNRLFILLILCMISTIYYCLAFKFSHAKHNENPHNIDLTFDFGYLRGLAGFLTGVLSYAVYRVSTSIRLLKSDFLFMLLLMTTAWCLHKGFTDLIFIPLFSLIVIVAAVNQGHLSRILQSFILQELGKISYSIYLMQSVLYRLTLLGFMLFRIKYEGPFTLHLPFIQAILFCLAYIATLVVISGFTYRFIENPARLSINRYAKSS